jgi:hypothetical protein
VTALGSRHRFETVTATRDTSFEHVILAAAGLR